MSLIKELKGQNIVIIAHNFNPSIFNRYWLVINKLIDDEDILQNSIFTPTITQVISKDFQLLVTLDQLQFACNPKSNFQDSLIKTLIPTVKKLQEIPYKAIGLNFTWFVSDPDKTINQLGREFFFIPNSNIFKLFDSDNSRYGSYMSKDFKNSRLKLDIKPINAIELGVSIQPKEYIQFTFNFHVDFKNETRIEQLIECLTNWNEYLNESQNSINIL